MEGIGKLLSFDLAWCRLERSRHVGLVKPKAAFEGMWLDYLFSGLGGYALTLIWEPYHLRNS